MKKSDLISLTALAILVVGLFVYAVLEPSRMARAESGLRQHHVLEAAGLYVDYCALCHGADGAGIGAMPAINNPALAEADDELLFRSIARAAHNTAMAAWHVEEGGVLNDYQIGELVTLIQHADWAEVNAVAKKQGFEPPVISELVDLSYMEVEDGSDPHACVACHEDPAIHLGKFGPNCARCHSATAWTPALLTKHTFLLDHGGEGQVSCETCHVDNYYEHDCYACHEDHQPDEMETVHLDEGLAEYTSCIDCHPTGVEGEAERLMNEDSMIGALELEVFARVLQNEE
jgi:mono/diheme cytochrome c family protein